MKRILHIDELLLSERIMGITTGDTEEKVVTLLGHPKDISMIYKKLGMLIFSYGNLQITLYENIITGMAVDPKNHQDNNPITIDQTDLDILNSTNDFALYLKHRRIDFYFENESIVIGNSHAFFSISDGSVCRFGLRDALVHGYVIKPAK